jgi:hypothetical protein
MIPELEAERMRLRPVPQVPFFGTWVLGCSDPFSNKKNQKGRREHPAFPSYYLNWLRGTAMHRTRQSRPAIPL